MKRPKRKLADIKERMEKVRKELDALHNRQYELQREYLALTEAAYKAEIAEQKQSAR